ncbi:FUSC family protein [Anaeromyxobacter paludicola]|uniref:Fusaric acid resistance protein n=1 Tax=Anaeromyxobacter paludicola TaxID=2918171 RepID=A0ABM7XFG5_9BACT|nr:FUSC family protein [Anaeromyxobacter paludicola]BDG10650.1 fusaric acid resistance protein [Anaeromyxobacter paludicola]
MPARPSWTAGLRSSAIRAWAEFAGEEARCWGYALRVLAACLLALWIALRLDLASPSSAALTALIVSNPRASLSLEKSLYRLLGTLVGAGVALLLMVLFPQQRDLVILGLAIWTGTCVAGSAWFRGSQAYGWALSGYTACLVAFATYAQPDQTFDIVIDRLTTVSLGVICGGVANAVAFPGRSREEILQAVRAAVRDFGAYASACLTGVWRRSEAEVAEQHFVRDAMRLETVRVWHAFEDPDPSATRRLEGFISYFMIASTTARAVEQVRADLAARGLRDVLAAAEPLGDQLLSALRGSAARLPEAAGEAATAAERLAGLARRWGTSADEARARLGPGASPEDRLELDSVLALLRQLLRDARELARHDAELEAPRAGRPPLPSRPIRRRQDPLSAAAAGIRAAVTFLAVCALWILTGWPDGNYAAVAAAVGCAIFAGAPMPLRAAGRELAGYALGLAAALVCSTFVLPRMQGFPLLAAGLAPFLLLGGYLTSRPSTAPLGFPYQAMIFVAIRITGVTQYDVEAIVNSILANMVGMVAVLVSFAVILPTDSRWRAARLERALTREVRAALGSRRSHLRHRFEAGVRDLTLQLAELPGAGAAERERRVLRGMTVLEAGHAVIALRGQRARAALRGWAGQIDTALDRAAGALESRDPDEAGRALGVLLRLRERVDAAAVSGPRAALVSLRTSLWLLQLAVAEHAAALVEGASARLAPEVSHAA